MSGGRTHPIPGAEDGHWRPGVAAALAAVLLLAGCGASGPPAAWRHACLAYNPGRDAIFPIGGYPVDVLDRGWRNRGGGLSTDQGGVLVLHARIPLTGEMTVVRMQTELVAGALRSDQCGPDALVVRGLSIDGKVEDSISLEQALTAFTSGAADFLKLPAPVMQENPTQAPAAAGRPFASTPAVRAASSTPAPAAPVTAGPPPSSPPPSPETAADVSGALAPYTPEYRRCMTTGEAAGGVTAAMQDCTDRELARQDARLNAAYHSAMTPLPPARQGDLRLAERGWLAERKGKCDAAAAEEQGGSLAAVLFSRCMLAETAARAARLEEYRP